MAKQVKLSASVRSTGGTGSARRLRLAGTVPGNIYAGKEPNQNLNINERELNRLLRHAVGENILVELEIDNAGAKSNRLALIQEIQHEPVSGRVLHVDFHAVKMDEQLKASVVVESVGEPNGVRNFGGLLEQSLRQIEIECLPKDLPELITVDVSELNIGEAIHIRDIVPPAGVTILDDAELTVFLVAAPKVEAEVSTAPEAAAQPEVIKEKKPDENAAPAKK